MSLLVPAKRVLILPACIGSPRTPKRVIGSFHRFLTNVGRLETQGVKLFSQQEMSRFLIGLHHGGLFRAAIAVFINSLALIILLQDDLGYWPQPDSLNGQQTVEKRLTRKIHNYGAEIR